MILHMLPGDATVETFQKAGIEGEIAVCRESLIEGDVSGGTLPEFWENRRKFLESAYPEIDSSYHENVVREFAKLTAAQSDSEINLWFEYELFCQANLWFCLYLLRDSPANIFRVAPVVRAEGEIWKGFGSLEPEDLRTCFSRRIMLTPDDIKLGADLWDAYRDTNHDKLLELSQTDSPAFPMVSEVCKAEIEKETRPKTILKEILARGITEFPDFFAEFSKAAGVYGYGDAQVRRIQQTL